MPHEAGFPVQLGLSVAAPVEAKTDSFLESFGEPQIGHFVPFQSFDRTRISLSLSHSSQWNS